MPSPAPVSGILPRILQSWWAPRRVVRGLSGMTDAQMLAVLMAAMLIFLIAQAPMNARAAHLDPAIPLDARMSGSLLAVMFIMPLLAYAVAGLVTLISRMIRRPVSGTQSRLALFWALLAVAPAMLLAGLVGGFVGQGPALTLVQAVAGIGFVVIWGAGLTVGTQA